MPLSCLTLATLAPLATLLTRVARVAPVTQGIGIAKAIISLSLFHEGRLFLARQFKERNKRNGWMPPAYKDK